MLRALQQLTVPEETKLGEVANCLLCVQSNGVQIFTASDGNMCTAAARWVEKSRIRIQMVTCMEVVHCEQYKVQEQ